MSQRSFIACMYMFLKSIILTQVCQNMCNTKMTKHNMVWSTVCLFKARVDVYNFPTIMMVPSRYLIPFRLVPVLASPLKQYILIEYWLN